MPVPARLLAFLALLLGPAAGCSPAPAAGSPAPGAAGPPAEPREVAEAVAETAVWERVLHLTGELAPSEASTISSQVAGRLERLAVDLGSRVKQGELLARIDPQDFELRLAQALASAEAARATLGLEPGAQAKDADPEKSAIVRETRAELDRAERERDRQQSLLASGNTTLSLVDAANAEYEGAQSRWQAAKELYAMRRATLAQREVEVQIARRQLAETNVAAPFDGVVQARLAGSGDQLAIGSPIARLLRTDPVRLRVNVPEQASALVVVGQEVRARFDSGAPPRTGKVARAAPSLGERDRTLIAEVDFENPDGALRPGSFARAVLVLDAEARTLVVPPAALVRFAGIEKVFVDVDGAAVERRVRVGRVEEGRVEVLEGLQAGERVVLEPGKLRTGTPLRVRAAN